MHLNRMEDLVAGVFRRPASEVRMLNALACFVAFERLPSFFMTRSDGGTLPLFEQADSGGPRREPLGEQAFVLREHALAAATQLLDAIASIEAAAAFRHMQTPGGLRMSVAMTNCGALGWTSDRRGYRYSPQDPDTGRAWPAMPDAFVELARGAAHEAGFGDFMPDACLVNRYQPGTRLSLHQDKDELDFSAPIVSVSLGIDAIFLFGGLKRSDKALRVPLSHGDVVVWGGADRLRYHGVLPLKETQHPVLGACRINLTFRKAGR